MTISLRSAEHSCHTFPTTFGTSAKTYYDKQALASVSWLASVISDDTVAILRPIRMHTLLAEKRTSDWTSCSWQPAEADA